MRHSYISSALAIFLYASAFTSAATIARRESDSWSVVARDYEGNHLHLAARGNTISMYTDYEKDLADLTAAETAGNADKAKKLNDKINKGLQKQGDSIKKLDEKTKKQLDKEMVKAQAITSKVQAANKRFDEWIAKLNKKKRSLVARGNTISMYTDYEKDLADLSAAETAGNADKAKKLNDKITKGLKKQGDSIQKLDEKTKKQLDKEMAKAQAITSKVQAANKRFDEWIAKLNKKKRSLVARGNTISMYTDYEKDLADLTAAETAGNADKAKKLNDKITKGLKKQGDSIQKLDEKTKKQLDKEMAKAQAITTKVQAANKRFDEWIAKLNKKKRALVFGNDEEWN